MMRASPSATAAPFIGSLRLLVALLALGRTLAFNLADDAVEVFDDPTRGPGGARGSYFGFSVGLQLKSKKDGSYRLLVGAPRANSTSKRYNPEVITEPGAVFSCELDRRQEGCKEIILDSIGNTKVPATSYHDYKNFGWLGGAMDVQPERIHASAACAYRWKNQQPSAYFMNGACYWFNSSHTDDTAVKLLPLIARDKQISWDRSVYNYAYGQAGFSVHFPDIDGEVLFGAPGILNWKGTVIQAKDYNIKGPGGNSRRRRRRNVLPRRRRQGRLASSDLDEDDKFSNFLVPLPYNTKEINDFSLFGYSVTSGRFWSESEAYYVAGAPRGGNFHGEVFIFLFLLSENEPHIIAKYHGQQMGEYFGAAVAAPDLNGDSMAELVVGAPLHALENAHDVGRIYVYVNNGRSLHLSETRYCGSEVTGARFGTTLMAPGDLNNDGYGDLLVGAPFENEGEGAVYAYYGSSKGLRPTFSQRLVPSRMSSSSSTRVLGATSSLRGFGMSISRGADVDRNGYLDIAIGSHDSGHAVLVRTNSVAKLKGYLSFFPSRLSLKDKNFTISACLNYSGIRVPEYQDVYVQVTIDPGLPTQRASFDSDNFISYNDTLTRNKISCKDWPAKVANEVGNYREAIQLQFEYRLASEGPFEDGEGGPDTLRDQPTPHTRIKRQLPSAQNSHNLPRLEKSVVDPEAPSSTLDQLSFVTGCEDDGNPSCVSDLVVNATLKFKGDPIFEIGSSQPLILQVTVSNLGEPAFLPNLTVAVLSPLDLVNPTSHFCNRLQEDDLVTLICDLLGPIKKDKPEKLDIAFDMSALSDDSPASLEVIVNAKSDSEVEKNIENNLKMLNLDLQANADIWLHSVSEEEQVTYSRLDADTINTTDLLTTTHTISIIKRGPTPLKEVILEVEIPINISTQAGNHNFAEIFLKEAELDQQPFPCQLVGASFAQDPSDTKTIRIDHDLVNSEEENFNDHKEDKETGTRRRRSDDAAEVNVVKRQSDEKVMEKEGEEKKKVVIWSGWNRVSSALMTCNILGWPRGSKVAKLTFSSRLNMTVLSHLMFASKGADFVTTIRAKVNVSNPKLPFMGSQRVSGNVTTHLIPGLLLEESVPWWVILLAALAGLLILFLLIFTLYKLGFFRRKKQEEMQEMRANTEKNEDHGVKNENNGVKNDELEE
ncbi:integrin alpha-PS5-like isoform X2 [Oratosquilla oratoria]|uniref:integrin alpha-PS5-like isoform X2 n=1 Tax=Oratosquilla oratoria TaxID=337810 RepID=UPI003F777373